MAFPNKLSQLCTPSLVYFVISVVGIVISIVQNMGNKNKYCLGSYECNVPSTIAVFIVKVICILFWTWILNLMCKDGHKNIAWFLVLFPFIILLVIVILVAMYQKEDKQKKQKKRIFNTGGMGSAASTMPYDGFTSMPSSLIEGMTSSNVDKVKDTSGGSYAKTGSTSRTNSKTVRKST